MNLTEGLSELKLSRARIARLIEARKKTLKHNKSDVPDKSFDLLTEDLRKEAEKARELKLRIAVANTIPQEDNVIIQDLVLQQGDLRSEIASLKGLIEPGKYGDDIFERLFDSEKQTLQKSRFQIEDMIQDLERQKRKLDARIQQLNWRTNI